MEGYLLTVNGANRFYPTYEEAEAVGTRAIELIEARQAKYDCVQVLDYLSIDKVDRKENGKYEFLEYDVVYIDGASLTR